MSRELIIAIITEALLAAQQFSEAFAKVHGRAPTVEEWRALQGGIKSPGQIEAEVRARLAPPAPANPVTDPELGG